MLTKCGKRKNFLLNIDKQQFAIRQIFCFYSDNINNKLNSLPNQGVNRPYIRGKGMLSRTCFNLHTQVTKRSKPSPKPA